MMLTVSSLLKPAERWTFIRPCTVMKLKFCPIVDNLDFVRLSLYRHVLRRLNGWHFRDCRDLNLSAVYVICIIILRIRSRHY